MRVPGRKQWSSPRYQRGVAAVELAILSMVMFFFLTAPLLIARSLMQATIAQRAAFSAAHMLATYPQYLRLDSNFPPISEASSLLIETIAESGLGTVAPSDIAAYCTGSSNCKQPSSPTSILITVPVSVLSPISIVPTLDRIELSVSATDRYEN